MTKTRTCSVCGKRVKVIVRGEEQLAWKFVCSDCFMNEIARLDAEERANAEKEADEETDGGDGK